MVELGNSTVLIETSPQQAAPGQEVVPSVEPHIKIEDMAKITRFADLVMDINDSYTQGEEISEERLDRYLDARYAMKKLLGLPEEVREELYKKQSQQDQERQREYINKVQTNTQDVFSQRMLLHKNESWNVIVDAFEKKLEPQLIKAAKRYLSKHYNLRFIESEIDTSYEMALLQEALPVLRELGIAQDVRALVRVWGMFAHLPLIVNDIEGIRRRTIKNYERKMLGPFSPQNEDQEEDNEEGKTPLQITLERDALRANKRTPLIGRFNLLSLHIDKLLNPPQKKTVNKVPSQTQRELDDPLYQHLSKHLQLLAQQLQVGSPEHVFIFKEALAVHDMLSAEVHQQSFKRGSILDPRVPIVLAARIGDWKRGVLSLNHYPEELIWLLSQFDQEVDHEHPDIESFVVEKKNVYEEQLAQEREVVEKETMDNKGDSNQQVLLTIKDKIATLRAYYRETFIQITYQQYLNRLYYGSEIYVREIKDMETSLDPDELAKRNEFIKEAHRHDKYIQRIEQLLQKEFEQARQKNPGITVEEVRQNHPIPFKSTVPGYEFMSNEQRREKIEELRPRVQQLVIDILQAVLSTQAA